MRRASAGLAVLCVLFLLLCLASSTSAQVTSTDDVSLALGSRTWSVSGVGTFSVGDTVRVAWDSDTSDYFQGPITAIDSSAPSITVDATTINGETGIPWTPWTFSLISAAAVSSSSAPPSPSPTSTPVAPTSAPATAAPVASTAAAASTASVTPTSTPAAAVTSAPASGVAVFNVTVRDKVAGDPFFGVGFSQEYVVNGQAAPVLTLQVGVTYQFNVDVPVIHPFAITTSSVGATTAGALTTGLTSGVVQFTPTAATPAQIFYQCEVHPNLGNAITVVGGAGEGSSTAVPCTGIYCNSAASTAPSLGLMAFSALIVAATLGMALQSF